MKYQRYLQINLPKGQSAFLWGARKTGKSHYLFEHFHDSVFYNLLETDTYIKLLKQPHVLRQEIKSLDETALAKPIIIDEVQKIPELLNEIHLLIETTPAYFILCGSSARKLKITSANLLGGRAWRYEFYPLVYPEIPAFNLLRALNHGLVPSHYMTEHWKKTIKAYINDYLKEEIQAEGLTRNLRAFAEFLDIAAHANGELINYNNIAQDCGIDAKTVKEYYQILVDTLLGYYVKPFKNKHKRKDLVATPKFYFFDVGVVNGLTKRVINALQGEQAGAAFEHYILMELMAYRGLNDLDFDITFWRTSSGLEVDFILGQAEVAIEVKISHRLRTTALHGIIHFIENYHPNRAIIVNTEETRRTLETNGCNIEVIPWQLFLALLWERKII
jgi:uncharacterized protein